MTTREHRIKIEQDPPIPSLANSSPRLIEVTGNDARPKTFSGASPLLLAGSSMKPLADPKHPEHDHLKDLVWRHLQDPNQPGNRQTSNSKSSVSQNEWKPTLENANCEIESCRDRTLISRAFGNRNSDRSPDPGRDVRQRTWLAVRARCKAACRTGVTVLYRRTAKALRWYASGVADLADFLSKAVRVLRFDSGRWCPLSMVDTIGKIIDGEEAAASDLGRQMRSVTDAVSA